MASTNPTAAANAQGMWDKMPDYMKYAAVTQGVGSLGSLAGGYFQGASADDQLEFQKLVNSQAQNQLQYQNKNNAYSPSLTFNKGLLTR